MIIWAESHPFPESECYLWADKTCSQHCRWTESKVNNYHCSSYIKIRGSVFWHAHGLADSLSGFKRQIQKRFVKPKSRCTFTTFFTIKQKPTSRTNNYTRDIHTCRCINLCSCKFESDVRVILDREYGATKEHLLTYLLTYLLHDAESFLRS